MNMKRAKIEQTLAALPVAPVQYQREHIKQELRQRIQETLWAAQDLSPEACLQEIQDRLLAIQLYCKTVGKTFIMIEEEITCNQFELGGRSEHGATLFRGPSEDASVAICVTHRGSLLHRNDSSWKIYKSAGDINPPGAIECLTNHLISRLA
ncbi:hypothetical protein [Oculatella sp. LEGE 06141]|uniref:hypothetical protein n=1 Tax=Oculatella sp. LEGE 06141 TaxID=1828648 RepID=UPI001D136848|nr:hypothetical protein [Oculatella sp. LEGE 06141]